MSDDPFMPKLRQIPRYQRRIVVGPKGAQYYGDVPPTDEASPASDVPERPHISAKLNAQEAGSDTAEMTVTTSPAPGQPKAGQAAQAESDMFNSGVSVADLQALSARAEHGRSERFRDHFERVALIGLYTAATAFGLMAIVWLLHLMLPVNYRWLDAGGLSTLQNFVTGGIIATAAVGHMKKRLGG